jgi:hypothetical protein
MLGLMTTLIAKYFNKTLVRDWTNGQNKRMPFTMYQYVLTTSCYLLIKPANMQILNY